MASDRRRHILIMSSWYPNRLDPFTGNFVERFAQLLSVRYQVSVIHTHGDKKCERIEVEEDFENDVHTIRVYHPVRSGKLRHWLTQKRALSKAFEKVEFVDLVFAHVILPRGLQFISAKKFYHCPLIVMEHASYYRKEISDRFSKLQRTIIKRTSLHINELLACSEFLQADMKQVFPTTRSTVLPNFVDSALFYPAEKPVPGRNKFLHVSTLDESVKDPETLLRGTQQAIAGGYTQLELTIVSDQPAEKWQELTHILGIASHVTFKGPMTWEEIGEEMRQHHAFILTSSYETFSIVLAESWLSGIPVITTPVGIGKNLDPAYGIQIAVGDPDSAAQAMQHFMDGKTGFDVSAIRRKGLDYREENIIDQLSSIFERHFDKHE